MSDEDTENNCDRLNKLQAEINAVTDERNKFENILSSLDTGLSLINSDSTIAWANDKIRKMFPKMEPIGKICHFFYESSNHKCIPCPTFRSFQTGHVEEVERYNSATDRWYHIIAQPIKNSDGQVVNVLEGITDITGRKSIELQLVQSEKRYRSLFEFMEDGFLRADANGNIIMANFAIAKMCGYESPEKMIGLHMATLYSDPNDREKMIGIARNKGLLHNYEILLKKKDGHPFWTLSNIKIIRNENGENIGSEGLIRDITDRKHAEKELLKERDKLQKALSEIKILRGILPICSHCKKIRDDKGYWNQIESYINKHSEADFSHSICPDCVIKYYPDYDIYEE